MGYRGFQGLCVAAAVAVLAFAAPVASAADWQAGGGAKWQDLLAKARAEGKVVVAGRPQLAEQFTEAFKRDTGLTMDFLGGGTRDQQSRVDREIRSGNVTIDVVLGGASGVSMVAKGQLLPIKPMLVLPGVTNPKNWAGDHLQWVDNAGEYLLVPNEYLHCWPLFNTAFVDLSKINSWKDLLRPEYKGKIAAFDPRTGGPGQAQAAYLANQFGIDFVRKLYKGQDVKLARDSRQLVEWVARGIYPIGLGTLAVHIERFKKGGIKTLVVKSMKDGPGSLLGGSSVAMVPKGAPHPNAAAVFLNWYASAPAQTIYASIWGTPSRRVDVKVDDVPDYVMPKKGATYLNQYAEDWYLKSRPKLKRAIVKALGR